MSDRTSSAYRAAQVERVRAWRQRNPTYHREMQRVYRSRRKPHLCPGFGGYRCMVWTMEPFCSFCRRTAELQA